MIAWVAQSMDTQEERNQMRGKPCAICGEPMKRPCKDESPLFGSHRGWLCSHCNLGIGHFRDNPVLLERAAEYLRDIS